MIIAGLGCKRGTPVSAIAQVLALALDEAGLELAQVSGLATAASKLAEPGIVAAAAELNLPLQGIAAEHLLAASSRALSHSQRVMELLRVPSLAETAALAAVGEKARLLGPRLALGTATCALAQGPGSER